MSTTPPLQSIYYHVTNRCNLRCRHCWVNAEPAPVRELSFEEAQDVILQALPLGLTSVKLTGGEPFVVPWLMHFMEFLSEHDLPATVETNGTLITPEVAAHLARLKIRLIAISLDGSTADRHEAIRGVKGCFDAAVRGIENLCRVGLRPSVLVAVDKSNRDDVPRIVALADRLRADSVKFNVVIPVGRGKTLEDEGMLLNKEEGVDLFNSIEELEKNVSLFISMSFPPLLCPAGRMRRGMCVACDVLHVLGLLPDGRVAMCGMGTTEERLVYGNVRDTPLKTMWDTEPHPFLAELRAGVPDKISGVCGRCMFKLYCRGSCRAIAFEHYGSVTAPQPACQEAWERDRVPANRLIEATTSS